MRLGPNFKFGIPLLVAVFVISGAVLYGFADLIGSPKETAEAGAAGAEAPSGPIAVNIVAKDLKFDKRAIVAGVSSQVTVTLDNQDPGVLHNIAFYTNRSVSQKIAASDPAAGPITETLRFNSPDAPGNYFFRCDVHPDTMSGTLTVR